MALRTKSADVLVATLLLVGYAICWWLGYLTSGDLEAICEELGLEIRRDAQRHLEQVHVRVHAAGLLQSQLLPAPGRIVSGAVVSRAVVRSA